MSIWGSLIGGMIGLSLGGPFGMLLGSILGGKISRARAQGGFSAIGQSQKIFALSLIVLSAKLSKADGQVSREELIAVKDKLKIPENELDEVGKIFNRAKEESTGYEPYAQQIERFRIREIKELEKLEKTSLKEQREDYSGLQERIEKLKEKYRLIRDQKIRERVEALGVKTSETDDRETLLRKEREYSLERQKIELSLESFYRSASSLVFQLNKRHITRHMSIFRCIDRRFETGEIFIKWDESSDEDWLILIYIKDNAPDKGIVIEDKTNPDKNLSMNINQVKYLKHLMLW